MPLIERDANKNEEVIFSDPNELKVAGLKTYETNFNKSKSNKRQRARRTLRSIPEISSSNQCKSWLDLFDDERSNDDEKDNNEVFVIEVKTNRSSRKRGNTLIQRDAKENEIAKKVVQEHIAKRPKLAEVQPVIPETASKKSSIIITKRHNEKTPSTEKLSGKSSKAPQDELSFELFEPNWVTKRPHQKDTKRLDLVTSQENKDDVYDGDYVPESKPAKSLIKISKTSKKKATEASKKKRTKKPNQDLSEEELAAKEKWEKECEDIANYKLIVEQVDQDF